MWLKIKRITLYQQNNADCGMDVSILAAKLFTKNLTKIFYKPQLSCQPIRDKNKKTDAQKPEELLKHRNIFITLYDTLNCIAQ